MEKLPDIGGCCSTLAVNMEVTGGVQGLGLSADSKRLFFWAHVVGLQKRLVPEVKLFDNTRVDLSFWWLNPFLWPFWWWFYLFPPTPPPPPPPPPGCPSRRPDYSLDRLMRPPSSPPFEYYPSNLGASALVFVIDSGIKSEHEAFGAISGTLQEGSSRVLARYETLFKPPGIDNIHGTHCAGTIAGLNYGVAKGTFLMDVQAFGAADSTPFAAILDGMEYVLRTCDATGSNTGEDGVRRRCVVSMSLGGGSSASIDQAVASLVAQNIVVVTAAGNENQNLGCR